MNPDSNKIRNLVFAETVCYSAASALLIAISKTFSDFSFFVLFALVPFLWRAMRSSRTNSILVGAMTATFLCLATIPLDPGRAVGFLVIQFLVLNFLFILYALGVNFIAKRIGFNAIFMALLWIPIEYLVKRYLDPGGILSLPGYKSAMVYQIGSLFGLLMVSFAVVLINSLILIALEKTYRMCRSHDVIKSGRPLNIPAGISKILSMTRPNFLFDRRAPPPPDFLRFCR